MVSNQVDFISSMPDPILEMILHRLPTTEVVRTSVLSKRGRDLWTSIPLFPSLNVDVYHALRPLYITYEQAKPLIEFVSWTLANKTVDLDSFRLCCAGYFEFSTVEMLVKAVVHRNVKSLDLKFYPKPMFAGLVGGLITIPFLGWPDYLCIDAANDPQGDFPVSFPDLKTLELTTTTDAFTMKVLIRILRCSPNLECLRLIIQKELLTSEHWELNEVEARGVLTRHLKRVKFLELNGEEHKLGIVRLLLEHGYELKEMVFSWCNEVSYHEKSVATMNEVSKFHKASSTVKLIALLKD